MEYSATESLFPLLKVLLGFAVCSIISAVSAYITFIGLLVAGDIAFLAQGDLKKGLPIFLTGILIFLAIFPFGAWFLQDDLRALEPNWLFHNSLVILFSISVIFISAGYVILLKILIYWKEWHPQNGEQKFYYKTGELSFVKNWKDGELHGEVIGYCPDRRIYQKANYENGKRIGEAFETSCAEFDKTKTISFYEPAGNLISEKKYRNGLLWQEMSKDDKEKKVIYYNDSGKITSENITKFEIDLFHREKMKKTIARVYDIETEKVEIEEIHDYQNQISKSTRRKFDSVTGMLISEESKKY